jgi:hypothetical protein
MQHLVPHCGKTFIERLTKVVVRVNSDLDVLIVWPVGQYISPVDIGNNVFRKLWITNDIYGHLAGEI